jgi:hypothetical protein
MEDAAAEIGRIRRTMDRSGRAVQPVAFNSNGSVRKGARLRIKPRGYRRLGERKRSHGELTDRIFAHGDVVKTEKASSKGFQRSFGKSGRQRAPGLFVPMLEREAESAGARAIEFHIRTTRLSQFGQETGEYVKKPLSQRWRVFADGTKVR